MQAVVWRLETSAILVNAYKLLVKMSLNFDSYHLKLLLQFDGISFSAVTIFFPVLGCVLCPRLYFLPELKLIHTTPSISTDFYLLTSASGMCSHCLGLSSAAKKEINSSAVRRVCRLDETNTSTGLVGEWVRMAAKVGLFIVAMRGQ